jgi:hypothetical protein
VSCCLGANYTGVVGWYQPRGSRGFESPGLQHHVNRPNPVVSLRVSQLASVVLQTCYHGVAQRPPVPLTHADVWAAGSAHKADASNTACLAAGMCHCTLTDGTCTHAKPVLTPVPHPACMPHCIHVQTDGLTANPRLTPKVQRHISVQCRPHEARRTAL